MTNIGRLPFWFLVSGFWFIAAACHNEPTPPLRKSAPPPAHAATAKAPPPRVARAKSTPEKCAGDGSYQQAVDCFRMSSGFAFRIASPAIAATGAVSRPRIGEEHVRIGEWQADAKATGIEWTRNGQRAAPPAGYEQLYQRLTVYLDPQKKEGAPSLVAMEPIGGVNAQHYHFTDANDGTPYDVWVSMDDGHIAKMKVGAMTMEFSAAPS